MPAAMEVILLERIDTLGKMGDTVTVKPGYARNYLLPHKKALRATKDNIAYFETQKSTLEKASAEKQKDAAKQSKKLESLTVSMIRHASESGQLYGSVTARDIAQAITDQSGENITRNMIEMNRTYKMIGLFPVTIALHPEVKLNITINIARSEEEAKLQAKSGKALLADHEQAETVAPEKAENAAEAIAEEIKEGMLEEGALEAEKQKAEEDAKKAEEQDVKAKAKAETKATKEAEKAEKEAAKEEVSSEPGPELESDSDSSEEKEETEA